MNVNEGNGGFTKMVLGTEPNHNFGPIWFSLCTMHTPNCVHTAHNTVLFTNLHEFVTKELIKQE